MSALEWVMLTVIGISLIILGIGLWPRSPGKVVEIKPNDQEPTAP